MSNSTELVPVPASPAEIGTLNPANREDGVTLYLSDARDRLALALQETGPESVASIRAELATVQEMTKQLGLSREIQDDAAEMVRRSEYALGKAIRAGQEAGEIRAQGKSDSPGNRHTVSRNPLQPEVSRKPSPYDFATNAMLHGDGRGERSNGIYAMTDGVDEEQFEEALTAAKEEGNVSRANVVRKIREVRDSAEPIRGETPETIAMWDRIRALAAEGYSVYEVHEMIAYQSAPDSLRQTADRRGIRFISHKTRLRIASDQNEWFERGLLSIETGLNNITDLVDLRNISHDDKTEALERLNDARNLLASLIRNIKKEIDK